MLQHHRHLIGRQIAVSMSRKCILNASGSQVSRCCKVKQTDQTALRSFVVYPARPAFFTPAYSVSASTQFWLESKVDLMLNGEWGREETSTGNNFTMKLKIHSGPLSELLHSYEEKLRCETTTHGCLVYNQTKAHRNLIETCNDNTVSPNPQ